jgi:hypothetical protein
MTGGHSAGPCNGNPDVRKYSFAVRVDKWNRLPELISTAQGKEPFKQGLLKKLTVKQRLEESKDGNSSDTKKSKKNNYRWNDTMTLRR